MATGGGDDSVTATSVLGRTAAGQNVFEIGYDLGAGSDVFQGGTSSTLRNRVDAGAGDDDLTGGTGADTLLGGAGDDTMDGAAGNDDLTGGAGADRFVFVDSFGNDVIRDFEASNDLEDIDLSAVTTVTDFADLSVNHMTQSGADVLINTGVGTIRLLETDLANLDADDFIF